jgi:hypothetical protein
MTEADQPPGPSNVQTSNAGHARGEPPREHAPMPFPDKIVIHQPWGGLGDNLQFSTLPEMFAAHGIPCFVSTRNALRNPEIGALVWGHNPFIKGYSDEPPNAGSAVLCQGNCGHLSQIERIELAHGLAPKHRYPKVYYRPRQRPELSETILIDLSSVSVQHRSSALRHYVDTVFSRHGYDRSSARQVRFQTPVAHNHIDPQIGNLAPLVPQSLFDYCDALASCKALVTVHSGAQALAVALRADAERPAIHCYCTPRQYNGRDFIYPCVDYHIAEHVLARPTIVRSILKRAPRSVRAYFDSRS